MSKSLGNFFTIKEVLDKYDSEVLRFFLLSAHYRSPLDFSDQNLAEAEVGLARIYKALSTIKGFLAGRSEGEQSTGAALEAEQEVRAKRSTLLERFREAMEDDFNTAQVFGHVFDLIRSVNRLLVEQTEKNGTVAELLAAVQADVLQIGSVLGIFTSEPDAYLERIRERKASGLEISPEEIDRLIQERAEARKARDFKRSDEIRDQLLGRNIVLLDGPQGTTWKVR